jgi:hypothetical protein
MKTGDRIAGGMSYRTLNDIGISTSGIMGYLTGKDEKERAENLKRLKQYYIRSINKIIARLELSRARKMAAHIGDNDSALIESRISYGIKWLEELKLRIISTKDEDEFKLATWSIYKKWHAIKLIPLSAEGYAIASAMAKDLELCENKKKASIIKKISGIRETFLKLMSLDENADMENAEASLIKAYRQASSTYKKWVTK